MISLLTLALLAGGRPWAVDVDAGVVRIAAAGDISEAKLSGQVETAALLSDGGYDAILLLGDDQYPGGALEDYQKYFAPTWGQFLDRLRPVPGNHEYYAKKDAAGYFEYFGARAGEKGKGWYSFDLGAWHLIALNTNTACKTVSCDAKSEQVKWLREDLAAHPNRCTLAYWHHPRFSSGVAHGDFAGAEAIWQTLQAAGADVVLNGHEHFYERFEPIGTVREFVVGTGGMSHYEVKPVAHEGSAVRNTDAYGILEMTLRPGSYEWRFVPAGGATFTDSGERHVPLTLALGLVLAWPADMVHDVEPGKEKFVKLRAVDWAEVEDPAVATAEVMESGELLLTGLKPGRTLVLLYAEGRFAVWRVRVGGKPEAPSADAAKKACPGLELTPAADTKLTAKVPTDACAKALYALFQGDGFVARELDLTFEGKVLQSQLKDIQAGLKKGLASRYVGAGLIIEGEVTQAEHRQVLWLLFKKSVGRVALEDRMVEKAP